MKEYLSKTKIINLIKAEKTFLINEFGVVKIGLFGSYAKDKQNDDSDIDILVELKEANFDWLAGLQIYMENKLGKQIELVRKNNLTESRFVKRLKKDIIYV